MGAIELPCLWIVVAIHLWFRTLLDGLDNTHYGGSIWRVFWKQYLLLVAWDALCHGGSSSFVREALSYAQSRPPLSSSLSNSILTSPVAAHTYFNGFLEVSPAPCSLCSRNGLLAAVQFAEMSHPTE